MDKLTQEQQTGYDKLVKLKTNFKKDSDYRKTTSYIENKLERLETLWWAFVKNDRKIQELKDEYPEHPYFTKNFFDEVENFYEAFKDTLQEKIGKDAEGTTGVIENNYTVKALRVQEETVHLLEHLLESIEQELHTPHSPYYYQQKLNAAQTYWNKVMLNHTEIVASLSESAREYVDTEAYKTLEEKYYEVISKTQEKLGSTIRSEEELKLPPLTLPVFEGDYQEWTSFYDIYTQLIHHNTRLGDAEKMQYLKTHLKKEASSLLQHLSISNANYQTAWQLLNDRYNNKRKLCSTQIQTILSQPKLEYETAKGIRKMHDTTRECLHALTNMGIDTTSWGPLMVHVILQKLDNESHKLYEQTLDNPKDLPTIETMFKFLESRFHSLDSLKDSKKKENANTPQKSRKIYKSYHAESKESVKCAFCRHEHKIYECQKFQRLSEQERNQFVQKNKLCLNCLMHKSSDKCRSRYKCNICQKPHHTLLHKKNTTVSDKNSTSSNQNSTSTDKIQSLQSINDSQVILATVLVKVRTSNNQFELLRALVDPGSQASFITEESASLLSLPRFKAHAEVVGVGLSSAGKIRHKTVIELCPRFPSQFSVRVEALILPHLTKNLPTHSVTNYCKQEEFKNIILADPAFHTSAPINIIIGADIFSYILGKEVKRFDNGLLGQHTQFGWILSGPVNNNDKQLLQVTSMVSHVEVDDTLKRFWEIENPETLPKQPSEEDQFCEQHFRTTHIRNKSGEYTVKIPFNGNITKLGESKKKALARLLQIERKFQANKTLEKEYRAFMQEYIKLNHMIPTQSTGEDGYYLPHHAVVKEDSTTTKLRVVFDASSKTNTGLSLNETMYAGPKLQNDLTNIILRWRKYRYVFTADVEKMYRQIKIHADHQKYHKILWRPTKDEPIQEYQLTTVTYGTASAPFLAIRTLHQLAEDEKQNYPQASKALLSDFYVDDLLTGAHSLKDARYLQSELVSLLKSGGFTLRKWTTNHQTLLQNIPEEHREKCSLELSNESSIKTLGLYWLPASDCFQFQIKNLANDTEITKRSVLSTIARIYDPIGWLSPVVIKAKILMQDLWVAKLGWDTPLPPTLASQWSDFKNQLSTVQHIKIPRWIKCGTDIRSIEYHGFCDASEKAYAAVIYTRVYTAQGDYWTTMLAAKTKVAPIKEETDTTLPRLELCAAVLLTKLLTRIEDAIGMDKNDIYLWTDSTVTLAWIKNPMKRSTDKFVAHRVSEILKFTRPENWHHVRSEDNPADCASRGILPTKLKNHPLWWTGPSWLSFAKEKWPQEVQNYIKYDRPITALVSMTAHNSCEIITRFSQLQRMVRVLTYCRRFISRKKYSVPLEPTELHETLHSCIKIVQQESFPEEMKLLLKKEKLRNNSKLISLTPFLDSEGILRIGGRLENSDLPYDEKHPIILPNGHHFTTLVIRDAHSKTLHGGNHLTLAYLRRKYWVINAKSAVRALVHQCVLCCRHKGVTSKQLMGNLPSYRVRPSKPFANTGIDYAGPFNIRVSKGRGTKSYKGYIAVFICLSTKAIHLEAVSDLSTEVFLAAYKRFVSRRGMCYNLYSDCGTTFVGASNVLDKQLALAIQGMHKELIPHLSNCGTKWHFIPPAAPHFGGLWEAGVKSTKYHLKRIAGDVNWTFEELTTLLAQVEACLNSRPLCAVSNDPEDLMVLTPGHFLVGEPLISPPEPLQGDKALHLLTRWQLVQKLRNDFWKVWSSEYLSRLQQRNKWQGANTNLKAGDIVLVKEDNLPPAHWLMGRIETAYPGDDGLVRVVTIKTAKNTLKRPVTKVCRLPFEPNELPNPVRADQTANCAYTNPINSFASVIKKISDKTPRNLKRVYPTNIPVRPPLDELRDTAMRPNAQKRIKIPGMFSVLLVLNLVVSVLSAPSLNVKSSSTPIENPVQITTFHQNPGLYMEHISDLHMTNKQWNFIVYYDLHTYYLQLDGFDQSLRSLEEVCNKTIKYNYYCKAILAEMTHKVEDLHRNNVMLHKRNGNHGVSERTKRGAPLGIIGNIQHALFGVLDQSYADYIEGEISKVKENENYLLSLAQNQTSIAEVTANVLKKTTSQIERQFEVFNNQLNTNLGALKAGIEENSVIQTLTASIAYTNIIMNNYETVQKELINVLLHAHNGGINPSLLTPQQLRSEINFIREHISTSLIIPGETSAEELLTLYKIMTIQSRVTDSFIIFQISIPLPHSEIFQLFKIHPVPSEHKGEFLYIEPSTEYLASSLHRDLYYPLTRAELSECVKTETLGYLCQPRHPLYTRQSSISRCEMELLNHQSPPASVCKVKQTHASQYWIQLHNPNHWIFVVDKPTTVNIVCKKQVIIKTLSTSGIIKLSQHCQVKHPTMTITSQTTFSNKQHFAFLPTTNLSTMIANQTSHLSIQNLHNPLTHLDTKPLDKIEFNQIRNSIPNIDAHHIHHYFSTYAIFILVILAVLWLKYPQYCKRTNKSNNEPFEVQPVTPPPTRRNPAPAAVPRSI